MRSNIRYFVNPKTRICQMLSGQAGEEEYEKNIRSALKSGYFEVSGEAELEEFRAVTRDAKAKGWNPDRMRYDTWLKKQ